LPPTQLSRRISAASLANVFTKWTFAALKRHPRSAAVNAFERLLRERVHFLVKSGRWKTAKLAGQKGLEHRRLRASPRLRKNREIVERAPRRSSRGGASEVPKQEADHSAARLKAPGDFD
jgi:hypothetical protein